MCRLGAGRGAGGRGNKGRQGNKAEQGRAAQRSASVVACECCSLAMQGRVRSAGVGSSTEVGGGEREGREGGGEEGPLWVDYSHCALQFLVCAK